MKRPFNLILGLLLSVLLAGCGGGGGGGGSLGPVASTLTFPLATANANLIDNGYTLNNLSVTGTQVYQGTSYAVTGTVTLVQSPSTPSTFEQQPALLNTQSMNGSVTVLSKTVPVTSTAQVYSTTNYAPLGQVSSGSYYVMQGTPTMPSTGKVGDTAVIGTFNVYDSTKVNLLGTAKISYAVEADTASTAIINLLEEDYDTSNTLNASTQTRWKIDASGNVTFVSVRLTGTTPVGPFNYLFQ